MLDKKHQFGKRMMHQLSENIFEIDKGVKNFKLSTIDRID